MMWRMTMLGAVLALLAAMPVVAQLAAPYAGQKTRAIKALSDDEARDLSSGAGMGLALAAELNGYPGPRHVLDLAKELELTAEQSRAVEAVHARMKAEAVKIGRAVLEREQALDRLFAERRIDKARLAKMTGEIGGLTGRLRAAHLKAHLETTKLLSEHQVHQYAQLRGYAGGAPGAHKH